MLSESELKLQVENYLSTTKTDYAILIDGEWGVGKTYFVKNLIEETLNNEEFSSKDNYKGWIYISLYGLRDTTDIDKMISINILKKFKMFQKLSDKSKTINAFGNVASSKVKSGIGHNSSNKILKNLSKISKIRIDDIVLVAQEFQVLKDYVLVIDDLERSDIPINELLGYINNLTETKETKVIAIANEKEIDASRLSKNRELKYIFSTLFTEFNRSDNDKENVKIINLEKIDSVANDFFRVSKEYSIIKEKTDLNEFITIRDRNFKILKEAVQAEQIDIQLLKGSEIYYSIDLIEMDLKDLVIENTDYLLIEFSTNSNPQNLTNFIFHIISQGFLPIFAHMERYSFLEEDLEGFVDLIDQGVIMQVNGSTFINKRQHFFIKACIKHNLIHLISSDTHNVTSRVPNNGDTYEVITKQYGSNVVEMLQQNAKDVIANKSLDIKSPTVPKKIFGKYI